MKFKAHETFFIRKGWLSKGMKNVIQKPDLFIDKNINPMDVLGLGSNMVKSLRYWLQVSGLTEEYVQDKKHLQRLTEFGRCVYENDKYLEESGTIQLIQYKLATNKDELTSWYFFFNKFRYPEFSREDFRTEILKYISEENQTIPSASSIEGDFDCIINTYLPRYKARQTEVDPENNIDCPLGEIGLVDIINRKKGVVTYKKSIPLVSSFNKWIVLAVIAENSNNKTELSLNDLLLGEKNIGRVFNLDSVSMLELLHKIEKTELLKIIRTSGLDVIQLSKSFTFDECVNNYYGELK